MCLSFLFPLPKRLPEVTADVSDAVRRGTLFSGVVLARGTEARYTVDGLKAVNRQLREDILPKVGCWSHSSPCMHLVSRVRRNCGIVYSLCVVVYLPVKSTFLTHFSSLPPYVPGHRVCTLCQEVRNRITNENKTLRCWRQCYS